MARPNPRVKLSKATPGSPPPRAPRNVSRARYDWPDIRKRLENTPGLWILAYEDVSTGTYYYVSRGRLSYFEGMGGYLECTMRNKHPLPDKPTISEGELWLRWEPEGWTEEDQARAEALFKAGEGAL